VIQGLFEWLTRALEQTPILALVASFIWGILSIILSPCHLASIPLIIGFIGGQGIVTKKYAFKLAGMFSVGILITIASIGVITGLMGRILGDVGKAGNYVVAIIFFIIGLHLLEVINIPFLGMSTQPKIKKKGIPAAFVIGLLFGLALGPCTFAYMAPVLGITFKIASQKPLLAVFLVLSYAIGHCSVIILAGTFTSVVQKILKWNEKSRGVVLLKKFCGILVIIGGFYLIFSFVLK
jgi:cytochrome c-type biogenesis protein